MAISNWGLEGKMKFMNINKGQCKSEKLGCKIPNCS